MERHQFTDFNYTLQNREELSIAQGSLTNSKHPNTHVKGIYPTHLTRGQACYVWDEHDRKYIDFICGMGTTTLGYAHPIVNAAAISAINRGPCLPLSTPYEVEAAEALKECMGWIDLVKFLKTGSEACSAALRIARAATGRDLVLSENYHGWHDEFTSLTEPAAGVPEGLNIAKLEGWNQEDLSTVAAIIIEPVDLDYSPRRQEELKRLREACDRAGTLLIFDEVITGFRVPGFSVTKLMHVEPDLICLGKGIANGFPLAAVAGKRKWLDNDQYFISSTYAGEMGSLAAAKATMDLLRTSYNMETLWKKGKLFIDEFNAVCPEIVRLSGYPTRARFFGDKRNLALFFQEACESGILFGPSWFFNFDHMEVMDEVLNTCKDILTRIKMGSVDLRGEIPRSPFSQIVRESKNA